MYENNKKSAIERNVLDRDRYRDVDLVHDGRRSVIKQHINQYYTFNLSISFHSKNETSI